MDGEEGGGEGGGGEDGGVGLGLPGVVFACVGLV